MVLVDNILLKAQDSDDEIKALEEVIQEKQDAVTI